MQRAASADALANIRAPNDKEDVRPAKWVEGGEKDKAGTGWKVLGSGDKRYDPSVRGGTSSKFGKANLIHINEDDTEQGSWCEAAIDAAFQLDRERYLFRDADVNVEYEMVYQGGNGQQMRADGGEVGGQWTPERMHASINSPGTLHDALVPLTSRNGYDGQAISWNQYQSIKQEQADQETVRDAKNQAWAAAKLEDIDGMNVLKWALIIGLWSFILLFHQDIGAAIASLGGGGGAVGDAASDAGLGMISLGVL
jgi:hypothetical protein